MFKLYTTTGTYPNLSKDELLFEHGNVNISGGFSKSIEDDTIPLETYPDAWDSYTLSKDVTVSGIFIETDTESVATQYKNIEKILLDYATTTAWTDQPTFNDVEDRDVLAFCFYIPKKDSTDEEITFYGMITGFTWNYASGAPHMNYELKFKCYARRWLL